MNNSTALIIAGTSVRQSNGLYSLNDLHKAAGKEEKNKPSEWMRNQQTKDLVAEISKAGIPAFETKRGNGAGIYACKELVIAYAAWISAAFHLKVIRVFLAQMIPATAPHNPAIDYDRISPAQAQDLKEIVASIVEAGVQGFGETWMRLQRKFKVNSYLELPATRHLEAREYLIAKLPNGGNETIVEEAPAPKISLDDAVRLDLAFTLASQTAAKVQRAVFNGVMTGDADWKRGRYLVKLDTDGRDGEVTVNAKQIERNAFVMPIDRFHDAIEDSVVVDAQTLAQLASTCMNRLGRMAQRRMDSRQAAALVA